MKRIILLLVLVLLATTWDLVVAETFSLGFINLVFLIGLVLVFTQKQEYLIWSAVAGAVLDIYSVPMFGGYVISLLVALFLAKALIQKIKSDNVYKQVIIGLVTLVAYKVLINLWYVIFANINYESFISVMQSIFSIDILWEVILMGLVLGLTHSYISRKKRYISIGGYDIK